MQSSAPNLYAEINRYKDKEAEYEKKLQYLQKIIQRDKKQLEERNQKIMTLQQARDSNKHLTQWKDAYYKVVAERDRLRTIVDSLRIENAQYEGQVQSLQMIIEKTLTQRIFASASSRMAQSPGFDEQRSDDPGTLLVSAFTSKSVTWADKLEVPEQPRTLRIPTPTSSSQRFLSSPPPERSGDEEGKRSPPPSDGSSSASSLTTTTTTSALPPTQLEDRMDTTPSTAATIEASEYFEEHHHTEPSLSHTGDSSPLEEPMDDELSEHLSRASLDDKLSPHPSPPPSAAAPSRRIVVYEDEEDPMDTTPSPAPKPTKKFKTLKPPPLIPLNPNVKREPLQCHSDARELKVPSPIRAPESPILLRPKRKTRKQPIYREPALNRKLRRGDDFTFGIPRDDIKQIYKKPTIKVEDEDDED